MLSLVKKFNLEGYCQGTALFSKKEILYLRKKLENIFKKKKYPVDISLFDIDDKKLVSKILKIYSSVKLKDFLNNLSKFYNQKVYLIPRFIIHRNYHVDRIYSPGIGWHRDCGGELKYKYCNKKLSEKSYVFGKLGIYLQENSLFGGSIDLIPRSHENIKNNRLILRKIKSIKLNFLIKIQKYFPNFYKFFSEEFYMKLLNAKRLKPKIGSFILFDSRIVHRGSPIDDKVRKFTKFQSENYSASIPSKKTKFSFYVDIGSANALDSYLYDRNQRKNNHKEVKILKKELKYLEIFQKDLAMDIKKIFIPVIKKYS